MGDRNYRNMIDPDEALKWVLDTAIPRPARRVSLAEASGLCLAEEIRADRDYPPFPRAMMDGYAVRRAMPARVSILRAKFRRARFPSPR